MAEAPSLYDAAPWWRHYEPGVRACLAYAKTPLPVFLEETADRFPDHTALVFEGYRLSYQALAQLVDRFAAALIRLGIRPGDRVAVLLPNVIPCVVSYYAILKVGAVAVMNNPLYTDYELTYQCNDSGARMVITLDLLADRMIRLRRKTGLEMVVYTSLGDYLPPIKRILFPLAAKFRKLSARVPRSDRVYRWSQLVSQGVSHAVFPVLDFEDAAMYQYTGGTTGLSKGVVLTHGNMSRQIQQIAAWFPQFRRGKETMLGALPFFHAFGLTTAMNLSVYLGWCNVLVPKPHPAALIHAISRHRTTFVPLVPTMYIGILNHPKVERVDLSCVNGCFSGGAPLPREVIAAFEAKTGAVIVEGYGLTEASPVTHINPFAGGTRKVGSIGMPISDTRCRIVDPVEGDVQVPPGTAGELLIKGPQVMRGYLGREDETRRVLTRDGWLYTGDIARMDEDGYFYIVDRKKDMVISGGYNIYPRDVEEVLFDHPAVLEAAVVGTPHSKFGEAVKAFVVLREGAVVTEAALIAFCRQRLARYKVPVAVEFRRTLPKNNIGKVLKKQLREQTAA